MSTENAIVPVEPSAEETVEAAEQPVEAEEPVDELAEARLNLTSAREDHAKATEQVLKDANEFARGKGASAGTGEEGEKESKEEKLLAAAREAQMQGTKKWYQFWQKATKIPKDNKYATYDSDEKITWKNIIKSNEQFLKEVVSEEGVDGISWKKMSNKSGVSISYSPEKSTSGKLKAKMYRLETQMNLAPKSVILGLVRGPVLGKADENLLYFREHYNFVGGKTSLVHEIRKIVSYGSVSARDFFNLTNWSEAEDGTIYYTASSVKALPKEMPDVVRGATLFQGLCLKPTETGGCDVTFLSQVHPRGWVLGFVLDWYVPSNLTAYLKALEKSVQLVVEDGNEDKFVRKFVLGELDVE